MQPSEKNFFKFSFFDDLKLNDVFKFSPNIDKDIPSKFFTVYQKNEKTTKFNAKYGKDLSNMELPNDAPREIMIFPNRKK